MAVARHLEKSKNRYNAAMDSRILTKFGAVMHLALPQTPLVGTNLIQDFMAVTFSVKLAFFREKRLFP